MVAWSFQRGTQDAQVLPSTPYSSSSFEHIQNSRTSVVEEVGYSMVAHMWQKEGRRIVVLAQ